MYLKVHLPSNYVSRHLSAIVLFPKVKLSGSQGDYFQQKLKRCRLKKYLHHEETSPLPLSQYSLSELCCDAYFCVVIGERAMVCSKCVNLMFI